MSYAVRHITPEGVGKVTTGHAWHEAVFRARDAVSVEHYTKAVITRNGVAVASCEREPLRTIPSFWDDKAPKLGHCLKHGHSLVPPALIRHDPDNGDFVKCDHCGAFGRVLA